MSEAAARATIRELDAYLRERAANTGDVAHIRGIIGRYLAAERADDPQRPKGRDPHVFSVVGVTEQYITVRAEASLGEALGHVRFLAPLTYEEAEGLEWSLREARMHRRIER